MRNKVWKVYKGVTDEVKGGGDEMSGKKRKITRVFKRSRGGQGNGRIRGNQVRVKGKKGCPSGCE